jgi:hypothetical protein
MTFLLPDGDPGLPADDCEHEKQIDPEGPEEDQLASTEAAARYGRAFLGDELIGLKLGEDEACVGSGYVLKGVGH